MAMKEKWNDPAGKDNNAFTIAFNMIASATYKIKGDTKATEGPKLDKDNVILSSELGPNVVIRTENTQERTEDGLSH